MRILKIFGDRHDQTIASTALKNALPLLHQFGYNTLFLECPYQNATIEQVIELYEESINIITLFPDAVVPKKLGSKQHELIRKMKIHYDTYDEIKNVIEKTVRGDKDNTQSHKVGIEILKLLKMLGMQLVCIDVRKPRELEPITALSRRNEFMFNTIKANSNENTKGIVFVGMAHIVDAWEGGNFHLGLISNCLQHAMDFDQNSCKAYYYYESEDDVLKDVRKKVKINSIKIRDRIEIINISQVDILQQLKTDLEKEKAHPLITQTDLGMFSNYFVPQSPDPNETTQTTLYIQSLGGSFLETKKLAKIGDPLYPMNVYRIPVSSLNKDVCEILKLDRLFVTNDYFRTFEYLTDHIKTLTIDKYKSPNSGADGYCLTFFDDLYRKGKEFGFITNREYIDIAKSAVQYEQVIAYLNQFNPHLAWKFNYDEKKRPIAILKSGCFNNEEGARFYQTELLKWGLADVAIKEEKIEDVGKPAVIKWHLIISGLELLLRKLQPLDQNVVASK